MSFTIKNLYNKWDDQLTRFRENIYTIEAGVAKEEINRDKPYRWWKDHFHNSISEELYKFSHRKWSTVDFDQILALVEDDEIIGISGAKVYHDYLRISMHLYILKNFRSKYLGIKYWDNGFFNYHKKFAELNGCKGIFFTVYPHSNRMKALISNHSGRVISSSRYKMHYINEVKKKGTYLFNNVEQVFFYYPIINSLEKFEPNEFIK